MMIFDFIAQDEIDELPSDDPQAAFVLFVRIAQRRLGERSSSLDTTNENDWTELTEARHGFMNVVIAAAKKFEIEPFASLPVPRLEDFGIQDHRQFRADLDHYLTQLLLDNSSRAKRDSVFVSPELKTAIRKYLNPLRGVIEKADDLDEAKRQVLLRRLSEFEAELEKKRLSLMAVMVLAVTILGAPGALSSSYDVTAKLLTNILRSVGEAKMADDALRQLPPREAPMAITGPRPDEGAAFKRKARGDMDDEIPF